MAASLKLTVNMRDGSTQTISHALGGHGHQPVQYRELLQALTSVQEQSNALLTTLVNQEKAQKNGCDSHISSVNSNLKSNLSNENDTDVDDDDDGDEEDSEDDDTDKPPPDKKQKT